MGFSNLIFATFNPVYRRPGSDLLSRALRQSTIGARGFHFRVRDGIGWIFLCHNHQAIYKQDCVNEVEIFHSDKDVFASG